MKKDKLIGKITVIKNKLTYITDDLNDIQNETGRDDLAARIKELDKISSLLNKLTIKLSKSKKEKSNV